MIRRVLLVSMLAAACGESKPRADTTTLLPTLDTVKPAVVSLPDTTTPATKATTKTKTKTGAIKKGGIVGRDSAIVMDPNNPRRIKTNPPKQDAIVGRDSAIVMDPLRPRRLKTDSAKKADSLKKPER